MGVHTWQRSQSCREWPARQARESDISIDRELAHLLVHAMLHLYGYDHEAGDDDEQRMLAREDHYFRDLSVSHGA